MIAPVWKREFEKTAARSALADTLHYVLSSVDSPAYQKQAKELKALAKALNKFGIKDVGHLESLLDVAQL